MNLQNTDTQKNLMRALAGESLARNRYTFAAGQAERDGLPVIAAVFRKGYRLGDKVIRPAMVQVAN